MVGDDVTEPLSRRWPRSSTCLIDRDRSSQDVRWKTLRVGQLSAWPRLLARFMAPKHDFRPEHTIADNLFRAPEIASRTLGRPSLPQSGPLESKHLWDKHVGPPQTVPFKLLGIQTIFCLNVGAEGERNTASSIPSEDLTHLDGKR